MADAVSMPSAFIASLFECLRRLSLRCFNAFGVYRFAVSMPSAFFAALFQWAAPVSGFQCLRRFSLRRSMPSAFLAALFNFVEGFAVQ